jgi:hypothetical protein
MCHLPLFEILRVRSYEHADVTQSCPMRRAAR